MMMPARLTALLLLLPMALAAQPTMRYIHGDPSNEEQLMLEMINRARLDPAAEGQRLIASENPDVRNAITFFNVDLVAVSNAFNNYEAAPPLAFNAQLIEAARGHSEAMHVANQQSHQLPGEPDLRNRTLDAGYEPISSLKENVYAFAESVEHGHIAFQIDWGNEPNGIQNPPGHREAIMDVGNTANPFTEIGIGIKTTTPSGSGDVGPLLVTQDFGRPNQPTYYIVGVVYEDRNDDGFYTPGEGLEGVTLMPNQGDYYATTSSSGGYAIPMVNVNGTLRVDASGGGVAEGTHATFTYNAENVKVDFIIESNQDNSNQDDTGDDTSDSSNSQNPATDFGDDADVSAGGAIVTTAWFGRFTDLAVTNNARPGILLHDEHGLIYYQTANEGFWWYSASLQWAWTSRDVYPFIYVNDLGWVYYFVDSKQPRVFFDMSSSQYFLNDPNADNELFYF